MSSANIAFFRGWWVAVSTWGFVSVSHSNHTVVAGKYDALMEDPSIVRI